MTGKGFGEFNQITASVQAACPIFIKCRMLVIIPVETDHYLSPGMPVKKDLPIFAVL